MDVKAGSIRYQYQCTKIQVRNQNTTWKTGGHEVAQHRGIRGDIYLLPTLSCCEYARLVELQDDVKIDGGYEQYGRISSWKPMRSGCTRKTRYRAPAGSRVAAA
ncbi:uncharacterized protein RAG0_16282 [Rhynchosporium agropyri]|uniref:Uncharacterized protein n=1 Tax=Rhynchosporium agropyri TaxID=914238 RepID=A0A1E1LPN6_9HELO|nr:uncharacterized protein RAG0_16282 [Rhynchosporium agropyri]